MRVYGRTLPDEFGNRTWVEVSTNPKGYNDDVYVTALIQCLKLNLGESPFYANFGIPAKSSVQQQIAPDYAAAFTQAYYSQFFASLIISKRADSGNPVTPTYNLSVVRHDGKPLSGPVVL
jgi:hypothetical protein